jgi:hypothetical protein
LRLVDVGVRGPNSLALVDLVASLASDDSGEGIGVSVGQFQADLARHRMKTSSSPWMENSGNRYIIAKMP